VFDIVRDDVGLYPIWLGRNGRHEGQNFRGDIAEVLVYDRGFLSEDAIQDVLRYLAKKWGAYAIRKDKGWTLNGPLQDVPKRRVANLPLSDQTNVGGWAPYANLTDEFEGTVLDPDKWWPRNPKWLGRQPALFHPSNVKVEGGELCLTMRKWIPEDAPTQKGYHDYTSAAVQSKERVLYGYFEIEALPMRSHGSSAFWFYESTKEIWTEIDVFEIGGGAPGYETKYNMNAHVFHTPEERRHWSIGGTWIAPWKLADAYHVYGLEWTREELKYYVDGVLVRKMKNTHWHQPLTLNFDSETMPNWFGMPRDADLPSTFRIRYVRTWKQQ
jgi:beta-glucanase (GH16 family)